MKPFLTVIAFALFWCLGTFTTTVYAVEGLWNCTQHFPGGSQFTPDLINNSVTLCKGGYYALHYDIDMFNPSWTAYRISKLNTSMKITGRISSFRKDPDLNDLDITHPSTSNDAYSADWNRGHVAPSAIMSATYDSKFNTYYTSNIAPQWWQFNQQPWASLESKVFDFIDAWSDDDQHLFIATGVGYDDRANVVRTADSPAVATPTYYWKALCDPQAKQSVAFIGNNSEDGGGLLQVYRSVNSVMATVYCDTAYNFTVTGKTSTSIFEIFPNDGTCGNLNSYNASHWGFSDYSDLGDLPFNCSSLSAALAATTTPGGGGSPTTSTPSPGGSSQTTTPSPNGSPPITTAPNGGGPSTATGGSNDASSTSSSSSNGDSGDSSSDDSSAGSPAAPVSTPSPITLVPENNPMFSRHQIRMSGTFWKNILALERSDYVIRLPGSIGSGSAQYGIGTAKDYVKKAVEFDIIDRLKNFMRTPTGQGSTDSVTVNDGKAMINISNLIDLGSNTQDTVTHRNSWWLTILDIEAGSLVVTFQVNFFPPSQQENQTVEEKQAWINSMRRYIEKSFAPVNAGIGWQLIVTTNPGAKTRNRTVGMFEQSGRIFPFSEYTYSVLGLEENIFPNGTSTSLVIMDVETLAISDGVTEANFVNGTDTGSVVLVTDRSFWSSCSDSSNKDQQAECYVAILMIGICGLIFMAGVIMLIFSCSCCPCCSESRYYESAEYRREQRKQQQEPGSGGYHTGMYA